LLYRSGVNITETFLGHIDIIIVVSEPDGRPTGLRPIATGSPKRTAAGDRRTEDLTLATWSGSRDRKFTSNNFQKQ